MNRLAVTGFSRWGKARCSRACSTNVSVTHAGASGSGGAAVAMPFGNEYS